MHVNSDVHEWDRFTIIRQVSNVLRFEANFLCRPTFCKLNILCLSRYRMIHINTFTTHSSLPQMEANILLRGFKYNQHWATWTLSFYLHGIWRIPSSETTGPNHCVRWNPWFAWGQFLVILLLYRLPWVIYPLVCETNRCLIWVTITSDQSNLNIAVSSNTIPRHTRTHACTDIPKRMTSLQAQNRNRKQMLSQTSHAVHLFV